MRALPASWLLFVSACRTLAPEGPPPPTSAALFRAPLAPPAPPRPATTLAVEDAPAPPSEAPVEVARLAIELENRLLRFGVARGKLGRGPGGGWPVPVENLFSALLVEVEDALGRAPEGGLPRRLYVLTRVATEFELEQSERVYGPAPELVRARLARIHQTLRAHLRANAEQNGLVPAPTPGLLLWPVTPVVITSAFGYRRDPMADDEVRFHAGIDLGGSVGDLVYAAAPGRVLFAGWMGGYGRLVVVGHVGGMQTAYGHLRDILVHEGAEVGPGDAIGLMGQSGRATGPHLHFEVRSGGQFLDPLEAIGVKVSTLAGSVRP